jgi:high-affinity iron transporter
MLGSSIIVFREVLEAALIVAIMMGASRGVSGRGRWIGGGMLLGLAGACVVAGFADSISNALAGRGHEIFNAAVLITAVLMLGWHNVWMSRHGRQLAGDMQRLGLDVTVGTKPLSALLVVTSLAVLREGSETVLFLYGLLAGGTERTALLGGGALGLAGGTLLGFLLYRGLLRIPVNRFFTVTGWIVLFLAAGLAASAADYLSQAGLLPALLPQVWDTSWLLNQSSLLGQMLHILVGYQDRPSGIGLVFYVVTVITIIVLMRVFDASSAPPASTAPPVVRSA